MLTDESEFRRVRPRNDQVVISASLPDYDDLPTQAPPTEAELEYAIPNPAFQPVIDRLPHGGDEVIDQDTPDFTYVKRRDPRSGRGPGWAGFGPFQPRDEL